MSFCLTLVPADAADVGIELSNHSELCVLTHFLPRIHVQGFPQRFPAKAAALTTQGCRLN